MVHGFGHVDAVSRFDQHPQRGVEIFALIGAIESVGEQHDFAAIFRPGGLAAGFEHIATPFRQGALRADAGEFFEQFSQ